MPQKKYVLAKVLRSEALDFVSNINPVPKRIAKEIAVGCEEGRVRHWLLQKVEPVPEFLSGANPVADSQPTMLEN
jgi:hypothetical protein